VGSRWETGRIEAFSDGVFAIAITLLVLDLGVPVTEFDNLWRGIVHEWPAYLGYATSFFTIGGIWLAHHGVFRRLLYADNRVMRINLLLLMAVSSLPDQARRRDDSKPGRRACCRHLLRPVSACDLTALRRALGHDRA
jgi:uncharacterized membrane protein